MQTYERQTYAYFTKENASIPEEQNPEKEETILDIRIGNDMKRKKKSQ